jgi:hypothetical protein
MGQQRNQSKGRTAVNIASTLRKAIVPIYRTVSMITLYGILFCIIGYVGMLVFFVMGNNWAVPFIVTSSDVKVLQLTSQVTSGQQTLNALKLDYDKTAETIQVSLKLRNEVNNLYNQFATTIRAQKSEWGTSANLLSNMNAQKSSDNAVLLQDGHYAADVRKIIEQDLARGLISKGDAQQQILALDQFQTNTTDSRVTETLLLDSVRQHTMTDINAASVMAQQVALRGQIQQLDATIAIAQNELATDIKSINDAQTAINTAKESPYFDAVNSKTKLFFGVMPYNAEKTVSVGENVYSCYVGLFFCSKVGTVQAVYRNEEMFEHPVLRVNMRGYIIKLIVDESAAKNKTLMVGSKPAFF